MPQPDSAVGTATDDAVEAGLDALDTPSDTREARGRALRLARGIVAPLLAVVLGICVWQALWAAAFWPEDQLPEPIAVWNELWSQISGGAALGYMWTSVSRAVIGFLIGIVIATPLGLLVAKVGVVRSAIGPFLSALQSLPSVAWVPAAVLWFGVTPQTIYTVLLLGSIPSIANGLVAGIDQIPPILPRVGKVMGAGRLAAARHILLPAALPGYLAGLKQGWAFSWRSLMAAEIIATSPEVGKGLGAYLDDGRNYSDMTKVIAAITLILLVGVGIELLVFRPLERSVLRARGLGAAR
jgi:NitT/TauT family transport system permease protein